MTLFGSGQLQYFSYKNYGNNHYEVRRDQTQNLPTAMQIDRKIRIEVVQ